MKRILLLLCILLTAAVAFPQTPTRAYPSTSRKVTKKSKNNLNLVGKTYSGFGNTCGMGIDLTITFLDYGRCKCTSDFYRVFRYPVTRMGTYTVSGSCVTVKIKPHDYFLKWEFKSTNGGRKLGFNNNDPRIQGSMKNDFLYLDLK